MGFVPVVLPCLPCWQVSPQSHPQNRTSVSPSGLSRWQKLPRHPPSPICTPPARQGPSWPVRLGTRRGSPSRGQSPSASPVDWSAGHFTKFSQGSPGREVGVSRAGGAVQAPGVRGEDSILWPPSSSPQFEADGIARNCSFAPSPPSPPQPGQNKNRLKPALPHLCIPYRE